MIRASRNNRLAANAIPPTGRKPTPLPGRPSHPIATVTAEGTTIARVNAVHLTVLGLYGAQPVPSGTLPAW